MQIRSDQGIPFSDKPVMKAPAIANAAIEALRSGKYDQVRVNFPNGDMVGHTGDLGATVAACTAADKAVKVRPSDLRVELSALCSKLLS